MRYAACEYKAEEVGIQACQSSTAVHNVQGAGHVDDEDDGGDHPQDGVYHGDFEYSEKFYWNCEL